MNLVTALLECPAVQDRNTRNTIVNNLSTDLGTRIERGNTDQADVMNIVSRVLDYPDGLTRFLAIVRFYEGNSIPMRNVNELVDKESVLKADLIEYLQKVNLPKEKLRDIYSKSRAKNIASRTPQLQFDAPETVVDLLWDMQAPKNENHISHPVIDFALRLLHWSQEQDNSTELNIQLQEWIERACLYFSLTPQDIQIRQQKINAESSIKSEDKPYAYLMIELAPDAIDGSNQYHVEFTLWNAEGKQRPLRQPEISVTQKNIWFSEVLWGKVKKV